jgi:archaeal flagellar protein FlaG
MSSETIVTALFLIGAVVAAGVLLNSVFPVIMQTGQSFGSVSHETDTRMRTDFTIVNIYAKNPNLKVWMKNIGTNRLSSGELAMSDMFVTTSSDVQRVSLSGNVILGGSWWNPGETAEIDVGDLTIIPATGEPISVSVVLPNGVRRSAESTTY